MTLRRPPRVDVVMLSRVEVFLPMGLHDNVAPGMT